MIPFLSSNEFQRNGWYKRMTKTLYDQLQVLERDEAVFSTKERLRAMNRPLLSWYETYARILPWRANRDPYGIWISEIMLQQTRVEAVKPYYERFMKALPAVNDLAEIPEDKLMKLWEGLGYYSRARNLKKAAEMVMSQWEGKMPDRYENLLKLPGIGSYTAGAIASIAFGQPVPAVDGNVLRVISRILASQEDILKQSTKKWMEAELLETMPQNEPGNFNQGLIEIGAIVCVPNGQPKCQDCPLASLCRARKEGLISQIPVKTPKKKRRIEERTVCILEHKNTVGLNKRGEQGLLASLYEIPNVEGHIDEALLAKTFGFPEGDVVSLECLPEAKHIFSHVEWHMVGYRIVLKEGIPPCYLTVEKEAIKTEYALPNAFGRYTKLIK